MQSDYVLSIQDVYNVITDHLHQLDKLWPDSEPHGPRKVHIVELIDAIKLRLVQVADKNLNRYESPFELAAKKITGTKQTAKKPDDKPPLGKSAMQLAHEEAQARIKRINP